MPKTTGEPEAGFGVPRTSLPAVVLAPDVVELAVLVFELLPEEPQAASPITAAHASSATLIWKSREERITSPIPS
ncbi:MAG TPA: hypothetical protein VH817_18745 [Thermoleophilaceae bacterium]|jgi:hypothetical protein